MAKDLLGQTVQKHVINSLKEAYGLTNIHDIPHYSIMTNKDSISHSHRTELLLRKLSDREKILNLVSPITWDEKNDQLIEDEKESLRFDRWTQDYYLHIISQKQSSTTTPSQEYFNILGTALLDPELKKFWLYDSYLESIWKATRTNTIQITYNGDDFIDLQAQTVFDTSAFMTEHYSIRDVQTPITEEKRFAEYSKDQIDKANAIFPLNFNFIIDKDILILEEPFYFLQLELLFNPKLSDLYDFRKKNQRQKNISYVKNIQKRNISTKYTYKEMKHRFKELLEYEKDMSPKDLVIYIHLFEKLTGRMLCSTFLKYYDTIMNNLAPGQPKKKLHLLLLKLLDVFIQMPSFTFKRYIIQELMEPLLLFGDNIYTNMIYALDIAFNIKQTLEKEYPNFTEQNAFNDAETSACIKDAISPYEDNDILSNSSNYSLINCYILTNI